MQKVLVAGATGNMGQEVIKLIKSLPNFQIEAALAPDISEDNKSKYNLADNVKTYQNLNQIKTDNLDIWIDFTQPKAAYENVKFALDHGIKPIVGTTGMSENQQDLVRFSQKNKVGGIIAANFGLSAVLLMKFAQQAAKYFPDVEIIEMHHAGKKDAPSGTAIKTAQLIDDVRPKHETNPDETQILPGVRGGDIDGIKIHSVRLPGYIAHEEVLFGGNGEALTIRQDSFDRKSFMNGVKIALEKIDDLSEIVIGLENIL